MKKREINARIVADVRARLRALGLEGKLDIFPVENVFTSRPLYWVCNGVALFKVLMWTINDLNDEALSREIDDRISAARNHFRI